MSCAKDWRKPAGTEVNRVIIKLFFFKAMRLGYTTQKGKGQATQFFSRNVFILFICLDQFFFFVLTRFPQISYIL